MKIRIVKLEPTKQWTVIGGRGAFMWKGQVPWSFEDLRRWLSEWCNEWTNLGEEDDKQL